MASVSISWVDLLSTRVAELALTETACLGSTDSVCLRFKFAANDGHNASRSAQKCTNSATRCTSAVLARTTPIQSGNPVGGLVPLESNPGRVLDPALLPTKLPLASRAVLDMAAADGEMLVVEEVLVAKPPAPTGCSTSPFPPANVALFGGNNC